MRKQHEYDQPMLAAIKALNYFHGDRVTIGDLKWAYRHFGGGEYGVMKAIERIEALVPGVIEAHYIRRKEDYTWIEIEVIKYVNEQAIL